MWDPYTEFESTTLSNGLTVHSAYWPGRPWEAMGFLIHSGAEHDPIGLEGLAHFVEHVVSGNANVSREEIKAIFEDSGGMVDFGATSYPATHYRFFVPTDKQVIARAFSVFGQMLLSARLENTIEQERQVIIGEFHRHYRFKHAYDLDMRRNRSLYANYWLERFARPLGNPESVGRITRGDLQSYYDTHYTPANMSVVGVGGMKLEEIIQLLHKSPLVTSKNGQRTSLPVPVTEVTSLTETRHVMELSKYVTVPVDVGAYHTVAKIPGSINSQVIHIMKRMLDRVLNEEVRERRAWTYHIGVSRKDLRHFHEFSINCSALALKAMGNIEEVIERCITSIGNREDLFEQVKCRALASNFMIDPTGKSVCDAVLYDLADNQRIIPLAEISDDLERVTMSDVQDSLKWLRPGQRWTLIQQP